MAERRAREHRACAGAFARRDVLVHGDLQELEGDGPAVHLVDFVLVDDLDFDHEQGVIKEVQLDLGAVGLRAALLEGALEHEFAPRVAELQIDELARLELELLTQEAELQAVLAAARLVVHEAEQALDLEYDLGQDDPVHVVVGRVLEHLLEQERVSGEARRRLGEEAIHRQLPRHGLALRVLDKHGKHRVDRALLFETQSRRCLVRTIVHVRLKVRHDLRVHVANVLDHGAVPLPARQHIDEPCVHGEYVEQVAEHCAHELGAARLGQNVLRAQRREPKVAEVLEVLDVGALRRDDLKDDLLPLALRRRHALVDVARHRLGPQLRRNVHEALVAIVVLQRRVHDQLRLPLQAVRTGDAVAPLVARARRAVAAGQQGEYARRVRHARIVQRTIGAEHAERRLVCRAEGATRVCAVVRKLVQLVLRVAQPVRVRGVVQKVLRIQRAAEEQHHVAVRDARQLHKAVDGFLAVEARAQHRLQGPRDLREERRMHLARHRAPRLGAREGRRRAR